MLLGQHRAHQAPSRRPVGENAHHVPFRGQALRRRSPGFSRSCGLLDQSFCQWATGKAVKAKMSGAASASNSATWGKGFPELFHYSVQLAVDLGGRQLLVDGAHHGGHTG